MKKHSGLMFLDEAKDHLILRHPKGHTIAFPKKHLPGEVVDGLRKLPRYAEGGEVQPDPSSSITADSGPPPDAQPAPTPQAPVTININAGHPAPQPPQTLTPTPMPAPMPHPSPMDFAGAGMLPGTGQAMGMAPPQAEEPAQPSQPTPYVPSMAPAAPQGPQVPDVNAKAYMDALNQGKTAASQEATAMGQEGEAQSKAIGWHEQELARIHSDYQNHVYSLDQERQQIVNDISNEKLDPNRVWHNASTGSKVSAILGLIVGGMGAGLTHSSNAALDVLNKTIDRDIEAQKMDFGKNRTLLEVNQRAYGNAKDAYDATRIQYMSLLEGQLKKAAAQAMGPVAKAQAMKTISAINLQQAQLADSLALRQSLVASARSGSQQAGSAAVRLLVPEKQQEQAFKELGTSTNAAKQEQDIMQAYDQANQENTLVGRAGRAGFSPPSVAAVKNLIMPMLKDNEGRINEYELARIDSLIPSPGDRGETVQAKRTALLKFIRAKSATPLLDAYGISPQRAVQTAPAHRPANFR